MNTDYMSASMHHNRQGTGRFDLGPLSSLVSGVGVVRKDLEERSRLHREQRLPALWHTQQRPGNLLSFARVTETYHNESQTYPPAILKEAKVLPDFHKEVASSLEASLKLAHESLEAAEAKLEAESNTIAKLQQDLDQVRASATLASAQMRIAEAEGQELVVCLCNRSEGLENQLSDAQQAASTALQAKDLEVAQLQQQRHNLNGRLTDSEALITNLRIKHQQAEAEAANMLQGKQQELDQLQEQKHGLETRINALRDSQQQASTRAAALLQAREDELAEAQEQKQGLEKRINEMLDIQEQATTNATAKLQAKVDELAVARQQKHSLEIRINELDVQQQAATDAAAQLQVAEQELAEVQQQKQDLDVSIAELQTLKDQAASDAAVELQAKEDELNEVQQQKHSLQTHITELEDVQQQAATDAADQLKVRNEELAEAQQQQQSLQTRVSELEGIQQQAATAATAQLQAKERELAEAQQQKQDLEVSITELQALKDQATSDAAVQLQAKQRDLAEVQQQKQFLDVSIAELQTLKDQAASDAAAQLQAKENELAEVQQQKQDQDVTITELQALKDRAASDAAAQLQAKKDEMTDAQQQKQSLQARISELEEFQQQAATAATAQLQAKEQELAQERQQKQAVQDQLMATENSKRELQDTQQQAASDAANALQAKEEEFSVLLQQKEDMEQRHQREIAGLHDEKQQAAASAAAQIQEKEQAFEAMRQQLQDAETRNAQLAVQQEQASKEAANQLQAKQREVEEVQQRCRAAEASAASLTTQQQQADSQAASQLQEVQEQAQQLQQDLQDVTAVLADSKVEAKALHHQLQAKEADLQAMQLLAEESRLTSAGVMVQANTSAAPKLQDDKGAQGELSKKQKKKARKAAAFQAASLQTQAAEMDASKQCTQDAPAKTGASLPGTAADTVRAPPSPVRLAETRSQVLTNAESVSSDSPRDSAASLCNSPQSAPAQQQQQLKSNADSERLAKTQEQLAYAKRSNWELKLKLERSKRLLPHLQLDHSKWILGKKLGAGAFGTVWTVDSLLYPNVVLKKGAYDKVYAEAERLSQLSHPNVEKVFAFLDPQERENGRRVGCMAVEKLGPSLLALQDAGKMFRLREVIVGFQGLASGLAYIHSKGLVDQDLNSGNVLQTLDGSAWVKVDLGNAVEAVVEGRPNKLKNSLCCVDYESPELADSLLENDWYHPQFSTDVWGLGQLMLNTVGGLMPEAQEALQESDEYEMDANSCTKLTKAPAQRKHLEYLRSFLTSQTDYADEVLFPDAVSNTIVGAELHKIIRSCLHSKPEARSSASEVAASLYQVMQQKGWSSRVCDTTPSQATQASA